MPLGDSVVLSTGLRLRGLIFAPDASSKRRIFCWIAVTSRLLRGTTLSRLLTEAGMSVMICATNEKYAP